MKTSYPCGRVAPMNLSRREMLSRTANGFGLMALGGLMEGERAFGEQLKSGLHHKAKAKSVIFLYMDGGPSQVDTFDYKPLLEKYAGKSPYDVMEKVEATQFDAIGKILPSPWKFKQHGESGLLVSELFPNVAKCIDDIAVIKSMTAKFPEHTAANYFLHTGHGLQGRPSMGAWFGYGLGSEK